MPIVLNGSGTGTGISVGGLPDGIVDGDTLASGVGGKILQVLQTIKTDVFTTTSTSYVTITGLAQAITASSTNNKILVNVTVYGGNSAAEGAIGFKIGKDGTAIDGNSIGAASGNNQQSGTMRIRLATTNYSDMGSFMYIDTPADTNAHTYQIMMKTFSNTGRIGTTGADGNYNQHMRCPCSITVMEIAA